MARSKIYLQIATAAVVIVCCVSPIGAQDFRSLEGRTITVRLDMPASSSGVDIYPSEEQPVDFRKVSDNIRRYGVGVHLGQTITITKVIVKGKNIEIHLGGGGFGTFGDNMALSADSSTPLQGETKRERDIKQDLKYTDDYWERVRLRRELDVLQTSRDGANTTSAAISAQTKQMLENERRAHGGSRFNLWYKQGVPAEASTPMAIMAALTKYVDFGNSRPPLPGPAALPRPSGASPALHKGLTVVQTEQILGPASKVNQKTEGSLEVTVREYTTSDLHITTQFVGGVLVDYQVSAR